MPWLPTVVQQVLGLLPQGLELHEDEWKPRHHGILALLWMHALALPVYAVYAGWEVTHSILEGGALLAGIAAVATWGALPRRWRSCAASVGLITASALLTHFAGGYIEAHFHFFVVLAIIALYQDWVPFGVAVLYVAVHHGAVGALDPGSVYNHPAGLAQPWTWGLIHAGFVLAESVAILTFWRLNEDSRARIDAVLGSAGEGILGLDDKGKVTFANRAAVDMLGRPLAGIRGQRLADVLPVDGDRSGLDAAVASRAARAGMDLVLRRPDGAPTPVDWSSSPVAGSTVEGVVVTLQDATLRRQAAELLQREKDVAEAAARAKAEFLANMSHEIRTPMNAVIGMTSLLADTPLTQEQKEYVETVRTSGEHLLVVINDILDFSKIEAGKLDLEEAPFSVRACVEDALDLVSLRAAEKNLDLTYLLGPGVPETVVGDVGRVRQVLVNLLGNAVKFTTQGEIVVIVAAEATPDGRTRLSFAVRDTGIGIAPEKLAKLFKPFTQADASTTRTYGGTGLGLAICKRLCELMGGDIHAASMPGQGATFTFSVRVRALAVPVEGPAQRLLAGRRVLIVDDNATNRQLLLRMCTAWGMVPQATGSPGEALAWVQRGEAFDLGLLDFHMPEMDGAALAASLRGLDGGRRLPLVLLSSIGRTPQELEGEGAPFAACLRKPLKQQVLYDALVGVLLGRQAAPAAAPAPGQPAPEARPLRVLLAEDNPVNQRVALKMLERLGIRADVAANGREAVDAVLRQRYDVILMDVQMPEMDGLEAARHIRRSDRTGHPSIIAMTANALEGDKEACLAAGMDDYLAKPIRAEALAAALEAAKAGRRGEGPDPALARGGEPAG